MYSNQFYQKCIKVVEKSAHIPGYNAPISCLPHAPLLGITWGKHEAMVTKTTPHGWGLMGRAHLNKSACAQEKHEASGEHGGRSYLY